MIPLDTTQVRQQIQDTHLNSQGMEALRAKGREGDPEALKEVARQFESMFVHQMFKQMRSSNEVFGKDSYFSSEETKFHQEMLDQQMSLELTKGRGLGMADMLYQQMSAAYGKHLNTPAESESLPGDLSRNESLNAAPSVTRSAAPAATSAVEQRAPLGETPHDFVRSLRPHAEAAAQRLGVKPESLIAQAALETGWGQHVVHGKDGANSHNLFNIKADQRWSGDRVNVSTLEYRNGLPQMERADFRQYPDYEQSFADYVEFLQDNPRYQDALKAGNDPDRYAEALQEAGYATDPAYAEKIKSLLRSEPMATLSQGPVDEPSDPNGA
ncbi:flagellar assembly peptidoglycan hydrolase FlgJ [Marinimicrobium sp. C2-29]|uniref:flagellar assembly peptidoglycan hydrolase FlgJ n=1 Tax=Marinimicrobium sp. C2-29 TaxID=3139825 RepID=UPI0031391895